MQSSFGGCCSLRIGVFCVGLLHLICVPLMWRYLDRPHIDIHQWGPFLILLMPLTIFLLVGVIKKSVSLVFPFVCMHFVIILMMVCHIFQLFIENAITQFRMSDHINIFVAETILSVVMVYFFFLVSAFYQELLHDEFMSALSINNRTNEVQPNNIDNNLDYSEPKKINSDKILNLHCNNLNYSIA